MMSGGERQTFHWALSTITKCSITPEKLINKGGRVRWPSYAPSERTALENNVLSDGENLDFLKAFWSPIYDREDLFQYRRIVEVWRMRLSGRAFKEISNELGIDQRKACALISGKNLRPYLVQIYLNSQILPRPRNGWKWILECIPKPTNAFPKALQVPEKIQRYQDIIDFLKQFPSVPSDHPAIKFFGLTSEWVEKHNAELFGFLLGFMVGDAGKYYPEYAKRSRHTNKTTLWTNMAINASNLRVLRFVQLGLATVGIDSHQQSTRTEVIRWVSKSTNVLSWMLRVCLGLEANQRTSRNPIMMNWILNCPRNFIVSFIQGIAESDGYVHNSGYYTGIASKPNSNFYLEILQSIGTKARVHPKHKPSETRITLVESLKLPLFSPIIQSYRFERMLGHAKTRRILPPLPSFF